MFKSVVVVFVAGLGTMPMPSAFAQQACEGKLSRLFEHAGGYDTDAILDDPLVAVELRRLLGSELEHLRENLGVRGGADLKSCDLVIEGNANHRGTEENGIVTVNLVSGAVAAGILSAGRITLYAVGDGYFSMPLAIRDWIAVVAAGFNYRFEPPAGTQLEMAEPATP
jgi:hypothetical protein